MSAQHTPGPWVLLGSHESEGFDCYWIKGQPSPFLRGFTKEIASVSGPQGGEAEANAHLIAAAPELLEALEFLANVARATPGFPSPMALQQADRAIAKARGNP
jgi:hypothetical protein